MIISEIKKNKKKRHKTISTMSVLLDYYVWLYRQPRVSSKTLVGSQTMQLLFFAFLRDYGMFGSQKSDVDVSSHQLRQGFLYMQCPLDSSPPIGHAISFDNTAMDRENVQYHQDTTLS